MPELPEVETIRRDLQKKVLNKKIINVQILHKKTVQNDERDFVRILQKNQIVDIDRIGKLIIFELKDKNFLLIHLKMTGQLIYAMDKEIVAGGHSEINTNLDLPNKHTRVVILFDDWTKLYFNDLRLFGYMRIVDEKEKDRIKNTFGIEPLTRKFTLAKFIKIFTDRKTALKSLLLNQQIISGLGNIYVDEVCFAAGLNPLRQADSLSKDEMKKLFTTINAVLKNAISHRGTTFNNYVDSDGNKGNYVKYLQVYGRAGEPCFKCKNILKVRKMNGRSTVFCPNCQK